MISSSVGVRNRYRWLEEGSATEFTAEVRQTPCASRPVIASTSYPRQLSHISCVAPLLFFVGSREEPQVDPTLACVRDGSVVSNERAASRGDRFYETSLRQEVYPSQNAQFTSHVGLVSTLVRDVCIRQFPRFLIPKFIF